jgi:hypothetical protein
MPIWLRKYTFNEIKAFYEEENKKLEQSQNPSRTSVIDSDGNVNVPDFMKAAKTPNSQPTPSYTTKASKK